MRRETTNIALALVVLVALACGGGGPPPPVAGKIAFLAFQNGNDDIYVINADGTGLTNVTNDPADDGSLRLNEGDNFAWSPDGERIAFTSTKDGPRSIYTIDPDGSNRTRLTTRADPSQPGWLPDGTRLAFVSDRNGASKIHLIDSDGSHEARLTSNDSSSDENYPAWSPDGNGIAFAGNDGIYVVRSDGSSLARVVHPETRVRHADDNYFAPLWSSDGSRIIFTCNCVADNGSIYGHIFVMNSDGSGITRIPEDTIQDDHYLAPAWSPTGDRIAYSYIHDGAETNVYASNVDGTNVRRLTGEGRSAGSAWSPDGFHIAFVKPDRERRKNLLYVMQSDGSAERMLTDIISRGPIAWSAVP